MDPFESDKWQRRQDKWARHQQKWAQRQEKWARRQERSAGRHSPNHGVFVGGVIITIGILFLLDNLGIIRFRDFWQYWPIVLIVFGLIRIADSHGPAAIIWGAALAGIGAVVLLDNLGIYHFDWNVFWPVILIFWGLVILFRRLERPWTPGPAAPPPGPGVPPPAVGLGTSDSPTLALWAIFGGGRRVVLSQDFRGGEVTAIFGGYEIDLRRAAIAQQSAIIDVNAMFGGIEIVVPETWVVEVRGTGIFGGFADETLPPAPGQAPLPQHLIVTGYAWFGGVAVKN